MAIAEELCDRIAVMYAGEVVETGAAEAVFADPLHPYTRGLVETAHELDRPTERLREIPGGCRLPPRARRAASSRRAALMCTSDACRPLRR